MAPRIDYDVTNVSVWRAKEATGPPEPLPTEEQVGRYVGDLMQSKGLLAWIRRRYTLRQRTLRSYQIGLRWMQSGPWLTIPVRDEAGELVNVRHRYAGSNAKLHQTGRKYCNVRGHGDVRLYPADRLPADGSELIVCCGEWDVIACRQVGIAAVTTTGGAGTWPDHADDLARRFAVTVIYDRGEEEFADGVAARLGARVAHLPSELPVTTDLADLIGAGGVGWLRDAVRGPEGGPYGRA